MFLAGLFVLAATQAGPAQGQIVPPDRWTIDYGRASCTLARRLGGDGTPILAFNAALGREPGELLILNGDAALNQRLTGEVAVRLDDGAPFNASITHQQRNGRAVIKLAPMPDTFLDAVAGARQLTVVQGNEDVLVLVLPNARAAIEALTRCNDDLMQSWGVDLPARRALSQQPYTGALEWASQIMPRRSTSLVFVAGISERGRPLDCRVVVSSLNERMDDAFCNLVRSRARFRPALDSQGRPVPSQYVTRVRWEIEGGD